MFIFDSSIVRSNPLHLCASLYSGHERFSPTVCSSLFSVAKIFEQKTKNKKKRKEREIKKRTLNRLQHLEDKTRCKRRGSLWLMHRAGKPQMDHGLSLLLFF